MQKKEAVALSYPKGAEAPFIAAKARGALAEKLIALAREQGVPIVENQLAADILTAEEIGALIPESTWEIIAEIFSFVVKTDKMV